MQHKNPKRPDGGRIFRSGLYSTAILAAAVVLAVLVNLAEIGRASCRERV